MGGRGAPGPVSRGAETPVWLATSDETSALVSGRYLKDRQQLSANPAAYDQERQDGLLQSCAALTGAGFPT